MIEVDARRRVLAPWMGVLAEFEAAQACSESSTSERCMGQSVKARAHRVLNDLTDGADAPVPAWIGASERVFDSAGRVRDVRPAYALRQMWLDRDAVLRLGIWGVLRALAGQIGKSSAAPVTFDELMAAVSNSPGGLPHGLSPSLKHGSVANRAAGGACGGFAASAAGAAFFNLRLRSSLRNLARLYDDRGSCFRRWLLPDYQPGITPPRSWAEAWTVGVVATYVDWLNRASGGSLKVATQICWQAQAKRFRPPAAVVDPGADGAPGTPRPAALPTDADQIHFDLVLQPVLAQLLDYDVSRWAAVRTGQRWFPVELSTKTLGQFDQRRKDPHLRECRNFTRYRGLTVEQVYMAVVIDHLGALASAQRWEAGE